MNKSGKNNILLEGVKSLRVHIDTMNAASIKKLFGKKNEDYELRGQKAHTIMKIVNTLILNL